jgi:ankyrin repeat protein
MCFRNVTQGVDIDAHDYDGRTALHVAASEGCAPALAYLLEHVKNPTPVDR